MCTKLFQSKHALLSHERTHAGESTRKLICTECDRPFSSKYALQKHIERLHAGAELAADGNGGNNDETVGSPEQHERAEKKPNVCHVCNIVFVQRSVLMKHMAVHNLKWKCTECDNSFAKK